MEEPQFAVRIAAGFSSDGFVHARLGRERDVLRQIFGHPVHTE